MGKIKAKKIKNKIVKKKVTANKQLKIKEKYDVKEKLDGYEFFNDLRKMKHADKLKTINSLFTEDVLIHHLEDYIGADRFGKKTILDFCKEKFIPEKVFYAIVGSTNNKYLLYLCNLLETLHVGKLFDQIEESDKMSYVTGAAHVLRMMYKRDKSNLKEEESTPKISISFQGVSKKFIENVNAEGSEIYKSKDINNFIDIDVKKEEGDGDK